MVNGKWVLPIWLGVVFMTLSAWGDDQRAGASGTPTPYAIFVSPTGDDNGAGTMEQPFATLERARDAVRALKQTAGLPAGGAVVYLRGGEYARTASFELDERDSGTADRPIAYRAYEGEEVRLTGAVNLNPADFGPVLDPAVLARIPEEGRAHALQIDLAALGITEYGQYKPHGYLRDIDPAPLELFINDRALTLARWPNEGTVPIGTVIDAGSNPRSGDYSNRGGTFTYSGDRPERWGSAQELYLAGFFNVGYADDNLKVSAIDTANKRITLASAHLYGIGSGEPYETYYAFNLLEEIDAAGEWFLDRQTGKLYLYPPEDFDAGAKIQASMLEDPLIVLENVSHVRIEGLTLEASRGMGVYIEGGDANKIAGNTIRNMGTVAVSNGQGVIGPVELMHDFTGTPESRMIGNPQGHFYQNTEWNRLGGTNHEIRSNNMYGLGTGGVFIGAGDRKTLVPGGLQIVNNLIRDYNRRDVSYRPAIWLTGVGNRAAHNLIHDAPQMAIYLYGNDHLIEYNEIHHVNQGGDDMGAFYMGRNPSEQGNVIRYNFFHHIGKESTLGHGTPAVYLDDKTSGVSVFGNVFYKAGSIANLKLHGAQDNRIENNISIDIPYILQMHDITQSTWLAELDGAFFRERLLEAVDITQPPYSVKYPIAASYYNEELEPQARPAASNLLSGNVVYNGAEVVSGTAMLLNNMVTSTDPGFADPIGMDFSLKEDAAVYDAISDFQPIAFNQIGLYEDEYRTQVEIELGAFELQSPSASQPGIDPRTVRFAWERSEGAEFYKLVVARDAAFTDIVYENRVDGTETSVSRLFEYNETYYWKVAALPYSRSFRSERWNEGGAGSFATLPMLAAPDAPVIEVDDSLTGAVRLQWEDVLYAQSYNVYRADDSGGAYMLLAEGIQDTVYRDIAVPYFEPYHYVVKAVNAFGESQPSNAVQAMLDRMLLEAESYDEMSGIINNISYVGSFDAGDWLKFQDIDFGSGENGRFNAMKVRIGVPEAYSRNLLEVRLDSVTGPLLGTLRPEPTPSFHVYEVQYTSLQPATGVRDVYLVAKNGVVGNVDWLEWFTTARAGQAPEAPQLSLDNLLHNGIKLSWPQAWYAQQYEIYRSEQQGQFGAKIATVTASTYSDLSVIPSIPYYYTIKAVNEIGDSPHSNEVEAVWEYTPIQAETYDEMSGVTNPGTFIGSFDHNDWLRYNQVNFGSGANRVQIRLAVPAAYAGQRIDIRIGSVTGPLIGTHVTESTGSFQTFGEQESSIVPTSGTHDVFFIARGNVGIGNIDWFTFKAIDTQAPSIDVLSPVSRSYLTSEDLTLEIVLNDDHAGIDEAATGIALNGTPVANGSTIPLYELALGIHSLQVTAADAAGNTAVYETAFETTTSPASLEALVERFAAYGWVKQPGISTSLLAKLRQHQLGSFVNQVNALRGVHITEEAADILLRDAMALL